jgi:putative ABC transport system permease protein
MGKLREYIKVAYANLKANKKRSFLTMLGIIIGISSVIMILAAGGGAKNMINDELSSVYSGMVYLMIKDTDKANMSYFTDDDIDFLRDYIDDNFHGATQVVGSKYGKADTVRGTYDITLNYGTPALEFKSTDPVVSGRFFSYSEYDSAANVGVITQAAARKLFGTTDVLGKTIEVVANDRSNEIEIIGIRRSKEGSGIGAMLTGASSETIEVPYTFMTKMYDVNEFRSTEILLIAETDYTNECMDMVQKKLEMKHGIKEEGAFSVDSWTDASKQFDSIMNVITAFVAVVAGIALLVGGIGVMNIMLVSVTERTREIGIRKSLGARTKMIMMQFMAEAGMITLIGGIIGIIIGLLLGTVICLAIKATPSFSLLSIIVSAAFSCGIGLFFGIYPAKRAAQLNPIDALRHE